MTTPASTLSLGDSMLAGCRRLFLRNYEVQVRLGVHDFERLGPQRILVNVDLYIPLSQSTPQSDQLHEVVDYDFIRSCIAQRVSQGHIQLQETLVDDLLQTFLAHPKVRAARVSTEKPDVYPDCEGVGVEVFGLNPV
jgi:dihydroneopterin aldolase